MDIKKIDSQLKKTLKEKYNDSILKKGLNDFDNLNNFGFITLSLFYACFFYCFLNSPIFVILSLIIFLMSILKNSNKNMVLICFLVVATALLVGHKESNDDRVLRFYNEINNPEKHYVILDHDAHMLKNNAHYDQCYAFDNNNKIIILKDGNNKNIDRVECLNIFRKN